MAPGHISTLIQPSFASLIVLNHVSLTSADTGWTASFSKHIQKRIIAKTFKSLSERNREINIIQMKGNIGDVKLSMPGNIGGWKKKMQEF